MCLKKFIVVVAVCEFMIYVFSIVERKLGSCPIVILNLRKCFLSANLVVIGPARESARRELLVRASLNIAWAPPTLVLLYVVFNK